MQHITSLKRMLSHLKQPQEKKPILLALKMNLALLLAAQETIKHH